MEEDIKVLEEFINNYKLTQEKYKDDEIQAEIERSCYFEEIPAQAIENLIKGYKELETENQSYRDYFGTPPCYDNADYIPKSKVREKIEELKQEIKDEGVDYDWNKNSIISVLQELLQEGDDK